jgi:hypothetical protein
MKAFAYTGSKRCCRCDYLPADVEPPVTRYVAISRTGQRYNVAYCETCANEAREFRAVLNPPNLRTENSR